VYEECFCCWYLPKETTETIFKLADFFIIYTINKEAWIRCVGVCTDGISAVIVVMKASSAFVRAFVVKDISEKHANRL
jgi:hypothetical protein